MLDRIQTEKDLDSPHNFQIIQKNETNPASSSSNRPEFEWIMPLVSIRKWLKGSKMYRYESLGIKIR